VSSIEPSFGPLAGGTLITITGGWLRDVQYATIGFKECYALENRSALLNVELKLFQVMKLVYLTDLSIHSKPVVDVQDIEF